MTTQANGVLYYPSLLHGRFLHRCLIHNHVFYLEKKKEKRNEALFCDLNNLQQENRRTSLFFTWTTEYFVAATTYSRFHIKFCVACVYHWLERETKKSVVFSSSKTLCMRLDAFVVVRALGFFFILFSFFVVPFGCDLISLFSCHQKLYGKTYIHVAQLGSRSHTKYAYGHNRFRFFRTTKPRLTTYPRTDSTWRKSNQNIIIITTLFIASAGMFSFHVLIRCYIVYAYVCCVLLSLGFWEAHSIQLGLQHAKNSMHFNFFLFVQFDSQFYHNILGYILRWFIVAGESCFGLANSFKRDSPSVGMAQRSTVNVYKKSRKIHGISH